MDELGPASDQFSIGIVFYELLTGRVPFQGASLTEVLHQVMTAEPARIRRIRPDVDPRLEAICLKMLAKSPANRYASLLEVSEALREALRLESGSPLKEPSPPVAEVVQRGETQRRGRRWLAAGAVAVGLVLLAVGAFLLTRPPEPQPGVVLVEVDQPGAEVRILSAEGLVKAESRSEAGPLRFSLDAGTYRVSVERDGYRRFERHVAVEPEKSQTVSLRLTPLATRPDLGDRDDAKWLLQMNADVTIRLEDGSERLVDRLEALPRAPLRLVRVLWQTPNTLPAFDAEDRQRFARCSELRQIDIAEQNLPSLEWLKAVPNLERLNFKGGSTSNQAFQSVGDLPHLRRVGLVSGPSGVTPEGLQSLSKLTHLTELSYNAFGGRDEGVTPIRSMKQLEHLVLWACGITDEGLAKVADFPRLRFLQAGANGGVTGARLDAMRNLPMLKEASFVSCRLTDDALSKLIPYESLETLTLAGNPVSDAGLKNLPRLPRLTALGLDKTKITSAGLAHLLPHFSGLTVLRIDDTRVDDEAVPYLLQFSQLRELGLRETRFTEPALERLRRGLPRCQITQTPPKTP